MKSQRQKTIVTTKGQVLGREPRTQRQQKQMEGSVGKRHSSDTVVITRYHGVQYFSFTLQQCYRNTIRATELDDVSACNDGREFLDISSQEFSRKASARNGNNEKEEDSAVHCDSSEEDGEYTEDNDSVESSASPAGATRAKRNSNKGQLLRMVIHT